MKGNDAIGAAAIEAGCRCYFGYPITPQNEIGEYLSSAMPASGGVFLQAESEVAAINMVYGASAAGARVLTSSSGPGISLKMEGISYLAAAELPCVIANIMRAGPGLGGIQPAQSDYFQATKGGGHGDYRLIVLAPAYVQELFDFTKLAFELADKYRTPVMVLGDGFLGQMMEVVERNGKVNGIATVEKPWAITGCQDRTMCTINTLYLDPETLEQHNLHLQKKFRQIEESEQRHENYLTEGAEVIVVAYGISARIAKEGVDLARAEGIAAGLLRPITLWPFPKQAFAGLDKVKGLVTVEMSAGQMIEDVRLAVDCRVPVTHYGRMGGILPDSGTVLKEIKKAGGIGQ